MPVRSRKDLATTLKQGKIEPVYLLYGPETKLRDDAARAIADEALRESLLREFTDSSFSLANELNKLSAAAMPSGKITIELVEALVSRSRELMNWELTDQMLLGNRRRALQTLEHLLDDGAPPVMLIGLIASNYRRMALAQAL